MAGISSDQYVCTGLDILLLHEPDLTDAMALVHSRIRRVFYIETNAVDGALSNSPFLHSLRALNHRFRVFKISQI